MMLVNPSDLDDHKSRQSSLFQMVQADELRRTAPMEKNKRSFLEMTNEDSKELITPPNSTIRKTGLQEVNLKESRPPLSPALSSPIAPRTKKQRGEGSGNSGGSLRSNGNLTLQELLGSLEKRKNNGELGKKPPYSYATLIGLAILQSSLGKLTLSQIYNWISVHFPYYQQKDAGWQNSIRHNLSLNDAFIKAEKSNDGKGHFWQVKPGCSTKFFKGETGSYEEIRSKLQNLDRYFGSPASDVPTHGLSVTTSFSRNNHREDDDEDEGDEDEDEDEERRGIDETQIDDTSLLHVRSSPGATPLHFKELHSKDSITYDEDRHNNLMGNLHKRYTDTIFSPQDFKKYSCSFNSSFEETSPIPDKFINDEPLFNSNEFGFDKEEHLRQSPLGNASQMDLLKTPKASNGPNYESTPMRFISSPHEGSASLKRWQTPSHLFEDLYCSPLFKNICTPVKETLPVPPPRNISPPSLMSSRRAKISPSGLFGVDVYAVWKRATERTVSRNGESSNQRLGIPFQSIPDRERDGTAGDVSKSDKEW